VTVTVAWAVVVPFDPVAVSVYVVVALGKTTVLPDAGTEPTPLSMLTDVALAVDHVSTELPPCSMVSGFAENETVRGGFAVVTVKYSACFTIRPAASQNCTTR